MHIAASHQNLKNFFKSLMKKTVRIKNVLICGGGHLCFYLALQLLQVGMQVKIIEKDSSRCETLCELLPKATVINADATSHDLLLEEGIGEADAVVAVSYTHL